jgi:predicted nucleic acid-binding protein
LAPQASPTFRVSVAEILDEELPAVECSPESDDNLTIASASVWEADLIVTGDKSDPMFLQKVEGISSLTPGKTLK